MEESSFDTGSLSLEAMERIAEELIRFSRALKSGENPSIEAYLENFHDEERAELLRELLLVEIEHRGQAGELVSFQEYRQRFPDDRDLLAEAEGQFRNEKTRPDSDQTPPELGDRLHYVGDYELLEQIGRGGMGVVYKARQMGLGRIVAVKMLLNNQLATDEDIARFEREAQLAAKLDHPNIVPVYEVSRHQGYPYFSMAYVEGVSLAEMVRDHPLTPKDAARYVQVAAAAVDRAHEVGILHRDLKPSNILIDQNDQVRITDFGLAKQVGSDETLTEPGGILGTASYMPPEQAEGNQAKIGIRSDVYSLGAVLYELLTGRPPFAAATVLETLHQVKTQEVVTPRSLNPRVPRDLETICLKCLQKEPENRFYGSAAALGKDLKNHLEGKSIGPAPDGPVKKTWKWCKRNPMPTALVILLVILAMAGPTTAGWLYALSRNLETSNEIVSTQKTELEKKVEELGKANQEKNEALKEAKAAVIQKRRTLYDSHMKLVERTMEQPDPDIRFVLGLLQQHIPQAGEEDLRHFEWYYWWRQCHLGRTDTLLADLNVPIDWPFWFSPDGRYAAYAAVDGEQSMQLKLIDRETGKTDVVVDGMTSVSGIVGDDLDATNTLLVAIRVNRGELEIVVWDIGKGKEIRRVPMDARLLANSVSESSCFSPDGQFIMFSVGPRDNLGSTRRPARPSTIGVWDLSTGKHVHSLWPKGLKYPHWAFNAKMAFSPKGDLFAVGDDYGSIQIWSTADWNETALLRPFDGRLYDRHPVESLVFNADGTLLISGEGTGKLTFWDLAKKEPVGTIQAHANPVVFMSLATPTGNSTSRLVSVTRANQFGQGEAKVWDVEKRKLITQLVGHTTPIVFAMLTRDGQTVITMGKDRKCKTWHIEKIKSSEEISGVQMTSNLRWVVDTSSTRHRVDKDAQGRITEHIDYQLVVKDLKTGDEKALPWFSPVRGPEQLCLLDNGKRVAFVMCDSSVAPELQVWDVEQARLVFKFKAPLIKGGRRETSATWIEKLKPSVDGRLLALRIRDVFARPDPTELVIFNFHTGRELGHVKIKENADFQWADNGILYVWQATNPDKPMNDMRVTLYDVDIEQAAIKIIAEKKLPQVDFKNWWFFPDQDLALYERVNDPTLVVLKLSDFTQVQTFNGYVGWQQSMVISTDGQRLATRGKILNLRTGQEVLDLESQRVLGFSPNGRTFATFGERQGQLELWIGASDAEIDQTHQKAVKYE